MASDGSEVSSASATAAAAEPDLPAVHDYLEGLQSRICDALEALDGEARFRRERFERPGGGVSRPAVLEDGPLFEKAAVHFTHTQGRAMPAAATERRPELAGRTYEAISVSLIVHPRNPYVPTCHANYRFFVAMDAAGAAPVWWFGGGFDCTPYYGFREDAVHWHRVARAACETHSPDLHPATTTSIFPIGPSRAASAASSTTTSTKAASTPRSRSGAAPAMRSWRPTSRSSSAAGA